MSDELRERARRVTGEAEANRHVRQVSMRENFGQPNFSRVLPPATGTTIADRTWLGTVVSRAREFLRRRFS